VQTLNGLPAANKIRTDITQDQSAAWLDLFHHMRANATAAASNQAGINPVNPTGASVANED
jgi:hypothetical protein